MTRTRTHAALRALRAFMRTCWIVVLITFLFASIHCGDRDPWQWPSAFMLVSSLTVTLFFFVSSRIILATFAIITRRDPYEGSNVPNDGAPCSDASPTRRRFGKSWDAASIIGAALGILLFAILFTPFIARGRSAALHAAVVKSARAANREELYRRLEHADSEERWVALRVLEERGLDEKDRGVFAEIFGNSDLPEEVRRDAGIGLTMFDSPHPANVIEIAASGLDSEDPEMQLSAAWVLSRIAPGAPEYNEPRRRGSRRQEHENNVPRFQQWWKSRQNEEGNGP